MMQRAERELLFADHPKLNFLVRSGNRDVLAFCEHVGYAIGPLLILYKCLIHEHQDEQ